MNFRQALQGIQQQLMQIGAVYGCVAGTITAHGFRPQRQASQLQPADCAAGPQCRRCGHHLLQRALQPPGLQLSDHIGAQLNPCAHFGKLRRSLKQTHIPVSLRRCNGRRQTANATARNQHLFVHGLLLCRLSRIVRGKPDHTAAKLPSPVICTLT